MKKTALLLVIAVLASFFAVSVCAANDYIIADFRNEATLKAFASTTKSADVEKGAFVDGSYEVITSGGVDPNITMNIKKANRFEAADYPVVRINYKIISGPAPKGQIFFETSTPDFKMGNPGTYTEYVIDSTTADWQDAVVDMELITGSMWSGTVKNFRVDPVVPAVEGDIVTLAIRYVGFFKSEKEARAFDIEKYTPSAAPAATNDSAKVETPAAKTDAATATTTAPKTADGTMALVLAMIACAACACVVLKKRTSK